MTAQKTSFLEKFGPLARTVRDKYGVPAELTLAQAAIESQWGKTPIGNNYFGIKKASRHKLSKTCLTSEQEPTGKIYKARLEFADYACVEDSVDDYAWLISNGKPYASMWQTYLNTGDVAQLAAGVAKVYATSLSYSQLLLTVLKDEALLEAARDPR